MTELSLVIHFMMLISWGAFIIGLLLMEFFIIKKNELLLLSFPWLILGERLVITSMMMIITVIWEYEVLSILTVCLCALIIIQVAAVFSRLHERYSSEKRVIKNSSINYYKHYILLEYVKLVFIGISLFLHFEIGYL